MMKIALISFHNAANFGAALQAFALQRALDQMGHSGEYINYVNDTRAHQYSMSFLFLDSLKKGNVSGAVKYLVGAPFLAIRKKKFGNFYKQYLHTTPKVYRNSEEAKELCPFYDRFIVGSDQVWNPVNNGHDTAFLLDFVAENRKKISYSSSFGLSELDKETADKYRECLSSFYALAVRETIGQDIVQQLIGKRPELVLDPVMLLSQGDWRSLTQGYRLPGEKYVFAYTNRESQVASFLKTGYPMDGKKLYKLSRYTRARDFLDPSVRVKYWMSPLEFVNMIDNAELVVSASFHCLAMSILLNKPFVAVLTGNYGRDERLNHMLKMFGLEDRVLTPGMTPDSISRPICWEAVNEKMSGRRKESLLYLRNAIGQDEI